MCHSLFANPEKWQHLRIFLGKYQLNIKGKNSPKRYNVFENRGVLYIYREDVQAEWKKEKEQEKQAGG